MILRNVGGQTNAEMTYDCWVDAASRDICFKITISLADQGITGAWWGADGIDPHNCRMRFHILRSGTQPSVPESVEPQDYVSLPPISGCAELKAARRFLVRHFIRTVECSTIHIQSGSVKATGRAPTVGPLHFMEVPFHLCTRARPSQNEKPAALLWDVAG